ncbi:transposase [Micromonospora sp. NPDC049374]|uniref:transposase n=1 Tax=Micromonospora sp. NPDC049374 TaxID=3154352 RepID=UPI003433FEC6
MAHPVHPVESESDTRAGFVQSAVHRCGPQRRRGRPAGEGSAAGHRRRCDGCVEAAGRPPRRSRPSPHRPAQPHPQAPAGAAARWAKKFLSAAQARTLPNTIRPRDLVGRTRRRLASELITELVQVDKKIKAANKELTELVDTTGSSLQDLNGIGPSGAARLIGDVADIHRFASRGHFASWNGTAPLDASSGDQQRHRLSRAGNRRINRALHIMAVVQLRHDTEGRAYYRRKLAAGKTPMQAMRALKRRLSDIVYRQMIKDAEKSGTGPGGHTGATLQSSAANQIPMIDTSEQSLPGPAEPQPRTPLLAAS